MYLYCISDGVLCKFGYSVDPQRRLKSLQTGSSSQLSLVHPKMPHLPPPVADCGVQLDLKCLHCVLP